MLTAEQIEAAHALLEERGEIATRIRNIAATPRFDVVYQEPPMSEYSTDPIPETLYDFDATPELIAILVHPDRMRIAEIDAELLAMGVQPPAEGSA